jgi:hypothetical protein
LGLPQALELGFTGVMVGGDALVDLFLPGLDLSDLQGLLQGGGLLLLAIGIPSLLDALLPQLVAGPKQARSHQA